MKPTKAIKPVGELTLDELLNRAQEYIDCEWVVPPDIGQRLVQQLREAQTALENERTQRRALALSAETNWGEAHATIAQLREERDAWRERFGIQTSAGWQTAAQAQKLHQEVYEAQGVKFRELRQQVEQAEAALKEWRTAEQHKL